MHAVRSDVRRVIAAILLLFLGPLALIATLHRLPLPDDGAWALLARDAFLYGGSVVLGLVAAWRLREDALRASFAAPTTVGWIAAGGGLGALALALNLTWGWSWVRAAGDETPVFLFAVPDDLPLLLLSIAVLPALFEEWLCRGILWTALRRVADVRGTILLTAALFAMLHGLNGAQMAELPTRFFLGLILGWLRARTDSLWPCVAAHLVNNAIVCFLPRAIAF